MATQAKGWGREAAGDRRRGGVVVGSVCQRWGKGDGALLFSARGRVLEEIHTHAATQHGGGGEKQTRTKMETGASMGTALACTRACWRRFILTRGETKFGDNTCMHALTDAQIPTQTRRRHRQNKNAIARLKAGKRAFAYPLARSRSPTANHTHAHTDTRTLALCRHDSENTTLPRTANHQRRRDETQRVEKSKPKRREHELTRGPRAGAGARVQIERSHPSASRTRRA